MYINLILMTKLLSELVCSINKTLLHELGVCHSSEVTCSDLLPAGSGSIPGGLGLGLGSFRKLWPLVQRRTAGSQAQACLVGMVRRIINESLVAWMKQHHPELCPPFVLFQ